MHAAGATCWCSKADREVFLFTQIDALASAAGSGGGMDAISTRRVCARNTRELPGRNGLRCVGKPALVQCRLRQGGGFLAEQHLQCVQVVPAGEALESFGVLPVLQIGAQDSLEDRLQLFE